LAGQGWKYWLSGPDYFLACILNEKVAGRLQGCPDKTEKSM
jgi:hypothetical protein